MTGPLAELVDRHSATSCRSWETGPQYTQACDENHSDMVKFSEGDPSVWTVISQLMRISESSAQIIRRFSSSSGTHINPIRTLVLPPPPPSLFPHTQGGKNRSKTHKRIFYLLHI